MKREMVVDTDWVTAVNVGLGLLLFAVWGLASLEFTFMRPPRAPSLSWETFFLVGAFLYLVVISRDKALRIGAALLLIEKLLQVVLLLAKASPATLATNEVFAGAIDMIIAFGACGYAVFWLGKRIRLADAHVGAPTVPGSRAE